MRDETILLFSSTYATMAASDTLELADIAHRLIPTPGAITPACGIAALLDTSDAERAVRALLAEGDRISARHRRESADRRWQALIAETGEPIPDVEISRYGD